MISGIPPCSYIKLHVQHNINSVRSCLKILQVLQNIDVVLNVKLDVRTRWNSTYHMITRMTKMMSSIVQFEIFY